MTDPTAASAATPVPYRHYSERRAAHGLTLQVHHHLPKDAPARGTLLILHGFLDCGATFAPVAEFLAQRGYHVIAPDQRGFGHSDRVSGGGYYHFPNYLADLDALIRAYDPRPLILVGHSMGGTVASLYAGARPERLNGLALLEGIGPPDMPADLTLTRTRSWLDQLAANKPPSQPADRDDAFRRLRVHHPSVPEATLRRNVDLLTHSMAGKLQWTHDPLHRTTAPIPFNAAAFHAFLLNISCPSLIVGGGPNGWHPPQEEQRIAAFPTPPQRRELADAGHMMHWTQPTPLAQLLADFADSICPVSAAD